VAAGDDFQGNVGSGILKRFVVAAVTKGVSAEAAGLVAGDVIVAVDGKKATDIALLDLRARLRTDPPGTVVTLRIRRQARTVRVTLRDLI
jgi:S1-C subfamily serine protease